MSEERFKVKLPFDLKCYVEYIKNKSNIDCEITDTFLTIGKYQKYWYSVWKANVIDKNLGITDISIRPDTNTYYINKGNCSTPVEIESKEINELKYKVIYYCKQRVSRYILEKSQLVL